MKDRLGSIEVITSGLTVVEFKNNGIMFRIKGAVRATNVAPQLITEVNNIDRNTGILTLTSSRVYKCNKADRKF